MTAPVAFLLDENVPVAARNAIVAIEPTIQLGLVGWDADFPPKRTPDPALLVFAKENG